MSDYDQPMGDPGDATEGSAAGTEARNHVAGELARAMQLALKHLSNDPDGDVPPEVAALMADKSLVKRLARRTVAKLERHSDTVAIGMK